MVQFPTSICYICWILSRSLIDQMAVRLLVAAPRLHPGGFDVEEHRFVIHGCQVCFA